MSELTDVFQRGALLLFGGLDSMYFAVYVYVGRL